MSTVEVIITSSGMLRFACDCQVQETGPLCGECRDRVWLRLGQLINQSKEPLLGGLDEPEV